MEVRKMCIFGPFSAQLSAMYHDTLAVWYGLLRAHAGRVPIGTQPRCCDRFGASGPKVAQFVCELAAFLGVECAVMVNSGSSANLVAVAAALEMPIPTPPGQPAGGGSAARRSSDGKRLRKGDEVLVSSVAWSTSVAPLYR